MDIGDGRGKILIIDDEQIVLDSCAEILKTTSCETATAGDGDQGIALVEAYEPDLVFVDLKMPGMSGIEVIDAIEGIDPTIVIVVITGYATVDSAIEAMKAGAYDFIPKPFTPDQFRMIAKRGLEKRRLVLETIALRREKEVLRENFAAIVSHELKSPLAAVQQNLFVLAHQLSDAATADQREQIERMKARIGELIVMVDTWLRGVSVNVDGISESFEAVSVSVPVTKAVECVQPHAIRKDIELMVTIDEAVPAIAGDEVMLTEALINIIGNAVKYSYDGGTVKVAVGCYDDWVTIAVSDSGVGIPETDLIHVFDDFYRSDTGEIRAGGAGLGLAIGRRIIGAHDGAIVVESEVGKGTTFTISLPTRSAESPQQASDAQVRSDAPRAGGIQ